MDKQSQIAAFRAHLEARLAEVSSGAAQARTGTRVDGDHRPANRGERAAVTSQGYLALGLGQRAETLRANLDALGALDLTPRDQVGLGSRVRVEDDEGRATTYILLPGGEGLALPGSAIALSPQSPIGAALLDAEVGDGIELRGPHGVIDAVVEQID